MKVMNIFSCSRRKQNRQLICCFFDAFYAFKPIFKSANEVIKLEGRQGHNVYEIFSQSLERTMNPFSSADP